MQVEQIKFYVQKKTYFLTKKIRPEELQEEFKIRCSVKLSNSYYSCNQN